jgi:hypothetical protein
MHNFKHRSNLRGVIRSLMRLFVPAKSNKTFLNCKDDNYTHYYINRKLAEGIEFISLVERLSKKTTVNMLI